MAGNGWNRMPLGEFVTLQRGHDLPDEQRRPGNVPVLGSFGITGWHDTAKAKGPGVTVGRSGASFGVVSYSSVDYWPLNTALYVIDFHGNDERFAYYFLKLFDFRRYNSGSAQPSLNRNFIHPVPVAVPPLPEQRAIAHILGTLDDKIALNRRMNETLEAIARALFQAWFVAFDPVRRNIERKGRGQPSPAASRHPLPLGEGWGEGVIEGIAFDHLFPDRFEDSELGEIPAGWSVGSLGDLASLNPETWSKSTRPDVINYVDLSNTKWGRIEAVTASACQDAPSRAQRVLRPGDTIVGTVRPGNGSYAFIAEDGLTGSTGFAVLRPRKSDCAEFTYLAATAVENVEALSHLADGGAYPAIRPEVVAATQVIRPDDKVLAEFAKRVAPLLAKMAKNEHESRILAVLRDTLLPKLISGELRIGDAERITEAAR
jgi:type I restriction enzyme S subunit